MSIALTILGISVLIILHELGHYLAARLTGMRVLKFSLGFGPKLFEKKIGETHWQVAAVLLGGYVQVHGMGPQDPSMPADDERSYRNKPLWQRALVIAAGPVANWLLAAVFVFALAISVGYSQFDESLPMLGEIVAGEPAAAAGLQENDRVLAVGGETVTDWPTLVTQIQRHPGKLVVLDIERGSERLSIEVTPRDEDGVGKFGVYPPSVTIKPGLGASLQAGFMGAWTLTAQQASLLWDWARGTRKGRLAGLPEIVSTVAERTEKGISHLFDALAALSVTLFLLNLLPIPALDGSRLLFLAIEGVRRKPVDEKIEGVVHTVGFLLLLALILFVSIRWFFV